MAQHQLFALLTGTPTLQSTHPQPPSLILLQPRQGKSPMLDTAQLSILPMQSMPRTHQHMKRKGTPRSIHGLPTTPTGIDFFFLFSVHEEEACLKVLAHNEQDLLGSLEGSRLVNASHEHATGHRQVEGVVRRLEGHNAHVVVDCELGQVCCARRGCGQVQQLPIRCLVCCLQDRHRSGLCAGPSIGH